ncbi:hypothetical protein [Priestia taiwanensis]|uniref:Uncharacterized protein n=1 Tax=Priestia taiwanensis TaxID=1347902 RepID=A0A917EKV5_9BACI|nr:hypothetical protein [Priestia taiwanensis]MBM7361950.1 hypothetical protein [Priestia taiwanensis]GGE58301.1 hypothetical protein GCM10007140_05790 [Priestia taiwanensis]
MKKMMPLLFVFVLSLTGIYAPSASAGNPKAAVTHSETGEDLIYHVLMEKKDVHLSPSNQSVQMVLYPGEKTTPKAALFKIKTSVGPRWVEYDEYGDMINLPERFNATMGELYLDRRTKTWENATTNRTDKDAVSFNPQTVTATQVWYKIDTRMGEKWIGYNL